MKDNVLEPWRNELYHHGILGMKWGVQNGPPYPLKSGQKSSSEKHQAAKEKKQLKKKLSADNKAAKGMRKELAADERVVKYRAKLNRNIGDKLAKAERDYSRKLSMRIKS